MVNADFIVPAARESITVDSDWNLELRSHIPGLLVRALDVLKRIPRGAHRCERALSDGGSADNGDMMMMVPDSGSVEEEAHGSAVKDADLDRLNFWLHSLPLQGVAKVSVKMNLLRP